MDHQTAPKSHVPSREYLPGWRTAIVANDSTRGSGYIFLRDHENNEYFAHRSAFAADAIFMTAQVGDALTFRAAQGPKGYKAFQIRRAAADEALAAAEGEENRGNR